MLHIRGKVLHRGAMFLMVLALATVLSERQAHTASAAAGTPAISSAVKAFHENEKGCAKANKRVPRSLLSAKASKLKSLCIAARQHANTVNFWRNDKHRWTLYTSYPKKACWQLSADELKGPRSLCILGRGEVRVHTSLLAKLSHRIKTLLPKPKPKPKLREVSRPRLEYDWLLDAFTCIHRFEGAWNANTGNGYYGGLQMDMTFQSWYGSEFFRQWGTADNWPPWAQIQAAERAYHGYGSHPARGFGPWPNTSRACGLL